MAEYTAVANSDHLIRRAYFQSRFIETIRGKLVFEQFAERPNIPRGMSGFPETFQSGSTLASGEELQSVEFTSYLPLEMFEDDENLVGVNPGSPFNPFGAVTGTELRSGEIANMFTRKVNANVEMYSKRLIVGKLKRDMSLDPELGRIVTEVGDMVGRSLDWLAQKLLLKNAVNNVLGNPDFSDNYRDIQFLGANGKTTLAAAGGAGTVSSPSTNVVAAPQNLPGGASRAGFVSPDWFTLDDIRVLKYLLDAERAMTYPGETYVCIVPPAVEERLLADSDFIRAARYEDATNLLRAEIGMIYGMRVVKTTESAFIVGVQDDADVTEGVDTGTTTDSGGATALSSGTVGGTNLDVGQIVRPRRLLQDLVDSTTATYWQADSNEPSAGVTNTTGPILPIFAMGRSAFGLMPLEGWSANIHVQQGPDKTDPADLFDVIAYKIAWARAVLNARSIKVMGGAVDGRTLSTLQNQVA